MKAVIQTRYGQPEDVLEVCEVDTPQIKENEALVRVRAASVHPDVWHVITGFPKALRLMGSGLRQPKNPIPGTDLAGVVESVGSSVTAFKPGDEVFGESLTSFQWKNGGAYAEYAAVRESHLALKPPNVSFEQAAAVPTAGIIALFNLHSTRDIKAGDRVLINGAGGGVGSLALRIAKARGAEVTGVDTAEKLDLLRSLGADHVIDYRIEDFTQSDIRYDLVFDVPGNYPFSRVRRVIAPNGTYILIGHDAFGAKGRGLLGSIPRVLGLVAMSPFFKQLPRPNFGSPDRKALMAELKDLVEQGKIAPIVDRTFPLTDTAAAVRYLAAGHAKGRIVITM